MDGVRFFRVLIASGAIFLCVITRSVVAGEVYFLSETEVETVKEGIRRVLKDPDSARFSNMFASLNSTENGGSMTVVCGFVNGKNSYGAYSGELPFFGMLVPKFPEMTEYFIVLGGLKPSELDVQMAFMMCDKNGVPLHQLYHLR